MLKASFTTSRLRAIIFPVWLMSLLSLSSFGQTDRITVNDGNFSNGATFAANGWTVSNGATPNHQWIVTSGHGLGAPFSGNAAFVSDNGTTNTYTPANQSNIFFWRDVTIPAGEFNSVVTFNWNQQGENSWDLWQGFLKKKSRTISPGFSDFDLTKTSNTYAVK